MKITNIILTNFAEKLKRLLRNFTKLEIFQLKMHLNITKNNIIQTVIAAICNLPAPAYGTVTNRKLLTNPELRKQS